MTDYSTRRVMMVDTQVRPSDVTKFPIIEAMLSVPRENFVPAAKREAAYIGECVDLAPNRVLLEARTLAKLLDALSVGPTERVLDVATGLGYSAAILGRIAGSVVAVEEDADLAAAAKTALADLGAGNVTVVAGPATAGDAKSAPYDVILLQGGVEIVPDSLLAQLAEGGRIGAIFMEGALGTAKVGTKIDGAVNWRFAFNAAAPVLPGFAKAREFAL